MGGESEIELNGESVMCPRSLLFLELVPNLLKNEGERRIGMKFSVPVAN